MLGIGAIAKLAGKAWDFVKPVLAVKRDKHVQEEREKLTPEGKAKTEREAIDEAVATGSPRRFSSLLSGLFERAKRRGRAKRPDARGK